MTPADLRRLMSTAEYQPGETTEQYNARHDAEHQLSSWRVWLPGLLEQVEIPSAKLVKAGIRRRMQAAGISQRDLAAAMGVTESSISQQLSAGSNMSLDYVDRVRIAIAFLLPITPASQADGGAPAAVRNPPAGAHFPEVSQ